MSFEIAPVGFSKPVAEVGAAGFSSIEHGWKDYKDEKMETAEDIKNIIKKAQEKEDPYMKDIYFFIMGKMNNYIKKIKKEDGEREKKDKFLDQVFQEKMQKTMNEFNFFYFENKNNIDFMNYFDELVELYVQTKDRNKSFLKAQKKELRTQINEIKGKIHSKMMLRNANKQSDDDSTESEEESDVEPAEEPTNFETESDSRSDLSLSDSEPETPYDSENDQENQ